MVRSNGAKLLQCCFQGSQSSSILLERSTNSIYKIVYQCGKRSFSSGFGTKHGFLGSPGFVNVSLKRWLLLGTLNSNWSTNTSRSIHCTVQMTSRDFYDVLGVSNNASTSEIKNAYLAVAKKVHPDTNKEDPEAQIKFQEAQKAYEVLKDEDNRSVYDQVGHEAYERPQNGTDDGFDPEGGTDGSLFGQNGGGADAQVFTELSLMEAVQGCAKTVTFDTAVACGTCDGTGVPPETIPETCKRCKGSGISKKIGSKRYTCTQCNGTGKFVKNLCKSCRGLSVVKGSKSVKLDIMAGIDDNEIIKVLRSGGADPKGNEPGDLYVTIKVREDPVFRRKGANIHVDAVLNNSQAVGGGTIKVPTLTGDVVVKVRPGTKPGQKLVLKKKGIKARNSASFGDQYVHFKVSDPVITTQRQREPIDEFSKDEQRGEYEKRAVAGASS